MMTAKQVAYVHLQLSLNLGTVAMDLFVKKDEEHKYICKVGMKL